MNTIQTQNQIIKQNKSYEKDNVETSVEDFEKKLLNLDISKLEKVLGKHISRKGVTID